MAKGASGSQAGQRAGAGAGAGAVTRSAGATPPVRGARSGALTKKSSGGASRTASGAGFMKFYTEDSPGIKIGPVAVLVLSVSLILFVISLHFWGRLTRG